MKRRLKLADRLARTKDRIVDVRERMSFLQSFAQTRLKEVQDEVQRLRAIIKT